MADLSAPPVPQNPVQGVPPTIVAPAPVAGVPIPIPGMAVPPAGAAQPPPAEEQKPTETLYIQNLNEKIKIPVLKASLRGLFKSYGEVLDVVAHSNLRMRGQAFVSFADAEVAKKALKEVRGFPLYSKPMVSRDHGRLCAHMLNPPQQISFARTRSDAVVKKLDAEHFDEHKEKRLEHKSTSLCKSFSRTILTSIQRPRVTRIRSRRNTARSGWPPRVRLTSPHRCAVC